LRECLKNLFKDVRILLNTPKDCNKKIRDIFPGQYLRVGICENILEKLSVLSLYDEALANFDRH